MHPGVLEPAQPPWGGGDALAASPPAATGTWRLLAAPDEPSEKSQLMNTNEAQRKVAAAEMLAQKAEGRVVTIEAQLEDERRKRKE